jgi:hypothetical protein
LTTIVGNRSKLVKLDFVSTNEEWWDNVIKVKWMWGLANTSFSFLDSSLLNTFVYRWHGKTSNFHILGAEITVTRDDVCCLLHLFIKGRLLGHPDIIYKAYGIELMVAYLGVSPAATDYEVTIIGRLMLGLHTDEVSK